MHNASGWLVVVVILGDQHALFIAIVICIPEVEPLGHNVMLLDLRRSEDVDEDLLLRVHEVVHAHHQAGALLVAAGSVLLVPAQAICRD